MWRWLSLGLLLGATTTADAEADYRLSDRFFFGGAGGVVDGNVPVGEYETSFLPNDFVGISTVVALAQGDSYAYDLGGQFVLAMPLRWVQPYGGAMVGVRTTIDDIAARAHLLGGVNVYASRNVRAFVEVRDPDITLIGDDHATQLVVGLRWSPDWFHRARPVTKVDTVWWSTLLAAGMWTGATLAR